MFHYFRTFAEFEARDKIGINQTINNYISEHGLDICNKVYRSNHKMKRKIGKVSDNWVVQELYSCGVSLGNGFIALLKISVYLLFGFIIFLAALGLKGEAKSEKKKEKAK